MPQYERLTAKKMPDSFNIRATQICIVPIYLRTNQNKIMRHCLYNMHVSIEDCDKFYDPVRTILVA